VRTPALDAAGNLNGAAVDYNRNETIRRWREAYSAAQAQDSEGEKRVRRRIIHKNSEVVAKGHKTTVT
jgi:hypothetical protein